MRETLRRDLTRAMKAHDVVAVAALRSALAAIDNAEAVEVAPPDETVVTSATVAGAVVGLGAAEMLRRVLTRADVERLVRGERDDRIAAALDHERLGRRESADRLRAEATVLARYLPDADGPGA